MAGQNIDVSGYLNWEKITTPSGKVGYIVPNSGLVYDPFLSQTQGRSVFFQNSKPQLEAQKKAEEERQRAIDLAEKQASPMGQALPILGGVAGLAAARGVTNLLPSPLEQKMVESLGANVPPVAPVAGQTAGEVAASAATPAAAGPFSMSGIGSAGNYILPAVGAYGAYNLLTTDNGPARGALQGAASGAAIGSGFGGPAGALVGAGIGGALGLAESFFDNPSTKELSQKRWSKLEGEGVKDAQAAFLANHPPGDTSVYQDGPRKGQKWTFENALADAKQDPVHFRLVYGNYDTFGNDWSTYTPDQQDAIVSRLANEGLYAGKKGDVVITDKERARQIKNEVLSGTTETTAVTPSVAAVTQGQTQVVNKQPIGGLQSAQPITPLQPSKGVIYKKDGKAEEIGRALAKRIDQRNKRR